MIFLRLNADFLVVHLRNKVGTGEYINFGILLIVFAMYSMVFIDNKDDKMSSLFIEKLDIF